jgi:ketopantoate reductase
VEVGLVAAKAWQVREAAAAMRPLVGERTFVVPLQNGIVAPGQLAAVLVPRGYWGVCSILALLDGSGRIRHVGVVPHVTFGELDGTASMHRDVLAGRPLELESQAEAVVRLGERLDVGCRCIGDLRGAGGAGGVRAGHWMTPLRQGIRSLDLSLSWRIRMPTFGLLWEPFHSS